MLIGTRLTKLAILTLSNMLLFGTTVLTDKAFHQKQKG